MARRALITGITGQDGSYLAELLLAKDYDVHGIVRQAALEDPNRMGRIRHIKDHLRLHSVSLDNQDSLLGLLAQIRPDEVYHLAGHSFVGRSVDDELSTLTFNITSAQVLLSSLAQACPKARYYFAGSSEMFGFPEESPQRETTPLRPRSAYGISKCAGFQLMHMYRDAYGLFAVGGILFNHESPRRGPEFVTRKITRAATRIKAGLQQELVLGNLESRRDWGYAPEYVDAMWRMLQQDRPDDYVIATGELHSVQEFVEEAFGMLDLDWQDHVRQDPRYMRADDVEAPRGDASQAAQRLGWKPATSFQELVQRMVTADLELARQEISASGTPATS